MNNSNTNSQGYNKARMRNMAIISGASKPHIEHLVEGICHSDCDECSTLMEKLMQKKE